MPQPSLRPFALFSTRFEVPPSTKRQNRRLEHPRRRRGPGLDVFATGKLAEVPAGIVVAHAGASGTALGTPATPRPKLARMQTPRFGPGKQAGMAHGKALTWDGVHRACALVLDACRCLPAPELSGGARGQNGTPGAPPVGWPWGAGRSQRAWRPGGVGFSAPAWELVEGRGYTRPPWTQAEVQCPVEPARKSTTVY